MSASGFTPIQLYRTSTAAATPSAGNLADGELAINLTDEKLYFKNASGVVKLLASNSGSLGSVTSVNASGSTTGLTFTGGPITSSGTLTLGGTLVVGNGGTGANTAAGARTNLGVPANDGTGATGTWGINITGNAGNVTGTVAVANGGTGATSLTSGYLLKGNGTSAVSSSVVYDTGTNVGIGTASPNTKLQVAGVIRAEAVGGEGGQLELLNAANSAVQVLLDVGPGDVGRLWSIPAGPITLGTNSAERMRIDSSGNVGIGTSSVAAGRMQVSGPVSDTDGTSLDQGQLFLTDSDNSTSSGLMIGYRWQAGVAEYARIQARNSVGASNLVLQGGGGNVGIGTSSPLTRLDVSTSGGSRIRTDTSSASLTVQTITNAAASAYVTSRTDAADYQIYTTGSEKMRIDSSGNLLVGTSTTKNRLTVTAGSNTNAPTLGSAGGVAYFTNSDVAYGLNVGTSASDGHVWLQAQRTDGTATSYNITLNEAGGNVGIGTSAPNYLLHLNQNGNTQAWISATNAGSNSAGIGLENQGQRNWQIWADRTNDALQFGNNNRAATNMAIKPAGQVRFIPLASAPSGAEAGDVYYDSGTNKLRCYNGTTWNDLF